MYYVMDAYSYITKEFYNCTGNRTYIVFLSLEYSSKLVMLDLILPIGMIGITLTK